MHLPVFGIVPTSQARPSFWLDASRMHICVLGVKIYTAARACFSVHSGIQTLPGWGTKIMGRELSDAGASRAEISAVDIVLSVITNNNSQ